VLEQGWTNPSWSFKNRAQALELMIIDEVSMLRPDMLDAMNSSLVRARGDPRPFGGVQVVLVGDLYQLPPVLGTDEQLLEHYRAVYGTGRFFPVSVVMHTAEPTLFELTRIFRQKQQDFLRFLSRIREGSITGEELDSFNAAVRSLPDFKANEFHLIVTPRRAVAAGLNSAELAKLPGEAHVYAARVEGGVDPQSLEQSENSSKFPADVRLEVKASAQVMFVKNDEGRRWVNGDLGIVEEISEDALKVTTRTGSWKVERVAWPLVKYEIDPITHKLVPHEYGKFIQFPLRLAWAATIHKMQGQTVDRIQIDLTGGTFETGMTYVALSRCRTMEGIRLARPLLLGDLAIDKEIGKYLSSLPR
jgi:hypothetical protein